MHVLQARKAPAGKYCFSSPVYCGSLFWGVVYEHGTGNVVVFTAVTGVPLLYRPLQGTK